MISDKTIDESTATYWCAFADKDFKNALDNVLKTLKTAETQKIGQLAVQKTIDANESINEGFLDAISRTPTVGAPGMVFQISNASPEMMKMQADHAAAATASAAAIAIPGVRHTLRRVLGKTTKAAIRHPVGTTTAIGTAVAAKKLVDASGNENDSWWKKLETLVNKIWNVGKFINKYGKSIAIAGSIAYGLFKTAGLWLPPLSALIKRCLRGNSLAVCEFDSNETRYKIAFDMKYKKWQLSYVNFSTEPPPPQETEQLMSTMFFRRFLDQCRKYIERIIDNEDRASVLKAISELSDRKTKEVLTEFFESDSIAMQNMFNLKYRY